MHDDDSERGSKLGRELLEALERARTRLAVAMAAETKALPAKRWQDYRETEERMRRCLKVLRGRPRGEPSASRSWSEALEALRRFPSTARSAAGLPAAQLCRTLRDALAPLEGHQGPEAAPERPDATGVRDRIVR